MKIFTFAASLRKESFNQKLITQANFILSALPNVEVEAVRFRDFEMPVYDGDMEETSGVPAGAQALAKRIQSADSIIISTPEYNGGIPGSLKNAIDWVSRIEPIPFDGKPILLIGASPGSLGAVRGLWHTRVPFEAMGAYVYPEMFGLPRAHQAFAEDGTFSDPKNQGRLNQLIHSFIEWVGK